MKNKIIILFTSVFIAFTAYSQNCGKKQFLDKNLIEDFDYKGQSSSAELQPGDTARTSVVAYGKNEVRIAVGGEPFLGQLIFKVIQPTSKTKKVVDNIRKREEEIPVYKKDKDGNLVQKIDDWTGEKAKDANGAPIYEIEKTEKLVSYDTTFKTVQINEELLLFDSETSTDKKYYQEKISRTKKLIIEVIVPAKDVDANKTGCVSVNFGFRVFGEKKKFSKN